ncbi:hypothetical protein K437DRAFT_273050 [Tilletiaria anomala UBC 951]|uniref:Cytoplasmic protein n=1 Tax=Tilletiaria anomala (strain ATCC 24038 / CBS 436.72 / UBC 951) TaxID=1037660 RepID=A0A066WJP0_TILAU|nr:uncharacterized protein K437DRAFT_273050 [Tilletiaria anomala UBC 951]KDN50840.1 hypothetical protein K437DRAFT_273050 [Tilletiaria anomala UBC 951]
MASSTSTSTSLRYRRWEPLQQILYGFATHPFSPESDISLDQTQLASGDEAAAANELTALHAHLIGLEVGDEVYVFEQLGHADVEWYRGYIVSTNRLPTPATSTRSLSDYSNFPPNDAGTYGGAGVVEEPQVYVGMFPARNVHIREGLDDAEMRMSEIYYKAKEQGIVGATAPPPPWVGSQNKHMETLPEEDETGQGASEERQDRMPSLSAGSGDDSIAAPKVVFNSNRQSLILGDGAAFTNSDKPPPPLPSLKAGDETKSGSIEPLVDEIACAIREWSSLMYNYMSRKDYALFQIVRQHIEVLHVARRQLLAQTLSVEEVGKLRRECVARLVKGNLAQGLDVIARHPGRGGLVDVDFIGSDADVQSWISGIRLLALQAALAYVDQEMTGSAGGTGVIDIATNTAFGITAPTTSSSGMLATLSSSGAISASTTTKSGITAPLNRPRQSALPAPRPQRSSLVPQRNEGSPTAKYFHVYLDVRAFVASPCSPGETAELYFSLYNKVEARFLTEEYCIILNHQGVPARESEGRLDKMRALFTDLSPSDMLDLNLVCRIVRNGAMRISGESRSLVGATTFISEVPGPSTTFDGTDESISGLTGSRRARMTSDRTFRRPFGCAVLELGQHHQFALETSNSSSLKEHIMPIFVPANEATFSTLHQDIIASRIKELEKSPRAEMLAVNMKVFHGDTASIVRENSSLLQDAVLTARLGFPDVVFPGDRRNEAYMKLWSGEFFPQGGKVTGGSTARNIQVSVEVRDTHGRVLENVISRGTGEPLVTEFDSMVFYHQNAPTWGELVKLELPDDLMEQCHLFFTIKHRSSKEEKTPTANQTPNSQGAMEIHPPIAYGYLPLFERTKAFIADGSHSITLFKSQRHGHSLSPDLYFNLQPTIAIGHSPAESIPMHLQGVFQPLRDSLVVRTFLVSTRYTQNEVVLKLINWNTTLTDDISQLRAVLTQFTFVGEVEIVKFLRDIFDALFSIMVSGMNAQGELDELVFNALVTVLGIVQDRRFTNFRATLDVYVEQHFRFTNAHVRLISSIQRLLADPSKPETSKDLRSSIKVWPYLFRFIVQSRENQKGGSSGQLGGGTVNDHLERSFKNDMQELLRSVNRLMSATKPSAIIGTQTLALQHFAGTYADLMRVFTLDEMARICTSFADAIFITKGRMAVWKLLHILQVTSGVLFEHHSSRSQLIPSVVRWIRPHLGIYDTAVEEDAGSSQSAKDAARITWLEGARLSVTVLAVVLDRLQISLVNAGKEGENSAELRQEQDNVDYLLSILPRLLQTYQELRSSETARAIERQRTPSTVASSVPVIFPSTYPFPLLAKSPAGQAPPIMTASSRRNRRRPKLEFLNCGLAEIAAVLNVLLMLSPRKHLASFLDEQLDLEGPEATATFLHNYFDTATSLLHNDAYPSTWLNFNVLTHQMVLKMIDPAAKLLIRVFIPTAPAQSPDSFDTELWMAGLNTLLTLLSSSQLVIEDFKPQRRRAVWRLAGDIRGEGAQIFARLWHAIGWPEEQEGNSDPIVDGRLNTGGFQVQFVPSLVEPVLELCLSHHDEMRTCAVRVLATMITSEWHLNGDFAIIEAEIIDKLDILFMTDAKGDEISRAFFIGQLRSLFEDSDVDPTLQEQVNMCLLSVNRFLDLLLNVRSLPLEEGYEDDRIAGTLKLLGFLRQANRVSAFSTHVLRLVNLHLENRNYVEGALTLKLYADLMTWDMEMLLDPEPDLGLPRQSHFARKETLYLLILDYLSKGEAWEISIDICRELAQQYEYRSANYARLSELLIHQASLYQKVATVERAYPAYFRVAYYGEQWPASLQGQMFVYRGQEWEKFAAFCDRLHQKHPKAVLIKSNSPPTDEVRFGDGQYLHVTALQPEPDRSKDVFTNPEVPPMTRSYFEHNATDLFSYTRPITGPSPSGARMSMLVDSGTDVTKLWVEKTYLRCEDAFPTVLRRSKVAEVQAVDVSPLENALNDVVQKREELETLEKKYTALAKVTLTGKVNTNRLSMALNGAVDAPINGGIPMYKRAFLGPEFATANPSNEELVQRLRSAIDAQATVIFRCIQLHSQLCPVEMRPFHQTLERFFCQNFADEISRLDLDFDITWGIEGVRPSESSSSLHSHQKARGALAAVKIGGGLPHCAELDGSQAYSSNGVTSPLRRHIGFLNEQANSAAVVNPITLDLGSDGQCQIGPLKSNASIVGYSVTSLDGGTNAIPGTMPENGAMGSGLADQHASRPGPTVSIYSNLTGHTVTGRPASRIVSGPSSVGGATATGHYGGQHGYTSSISAASSKYAGMGVVSEDSVSSIHGADGGSISNRVSGAGNLFAKYAGAGSNRLSKLMGGVRKTKA